MASVHFKDFSERLKCVLPAVSLVIVAVGFFWQSGILGSNELHSFPSFCLTHKMRDEASTTSEIKDM